jgi:hypothetical protein
MVKTLLCRQNSAFHHVFQGFIERILPQPGQSMARWPAEKIEILNAVRAVEATEGWHDEPLRDFRRGSGGEQFSKKNY